MTSGKEIIRGVLGIYGRPGRNPNWNSMDFIKTFFFFLLRANSFFFSGRKKGVITRREEKRREKRGECVKKTILIFVRVGGGSVNLGYCAMCQKQPKKSQRRKKMIMRDGKAKGEKEARGEDGCRLPPTPIASLLLVLLLSLSLSAFSWVSHERKRE